MKHNCDATGGAKRRSLTTELLVLPDGRILVQNLTPTFAELLTELNSADEQIAPRAAISRFTLHVSRTHELPD